MYSMTQKYGIVELIIMCLNFELVNGKKIAVLNSRGYEYSNIAFRFVIIYKFFDH